ncbi:MAG TPA: hypothetical protein VHZ76_09250, partial [Gammaproteobacteria bacterium]|nr:hypothetical protein [Gammaproteobacteria bacterium]
MYINIKLSQRWIFSSLFFMMVICLPTIASAMLSMELTRGVSGAIPIAVVPFATPDVQLPQDVSQIIANDLQNSGRFKVYGRNALNQFPSHVNAISPEYFRRLNVNNVVVGKVEVVGDRYQV